ncbi:Alpha-1,3-mannosyltransferase-like protein [Rhodotorula kratochvilovae]
MEAPPVQRVDPDSYPPLPLPASLRIAFIHPDLGLGGAERLVVDAAVALQKRGHEVEVFTSYHEGGKDGRSFEETRDGTLKVHVLGNSLFPRSLFGRFTIVCAMLRQLHLVFSFLLAQLLYHLSSIPLLSLLILPLDTPFASSADWSPRRQFEPFDVLVVDQLSAAVPLLRWWGLNRVVFYCHFPDLLLSPSSSTSRRLAAAAHDPRTGAPFSLSGELRKTYRAPIDALEQASTGEADKILVNSRFTAEVFENTFSALGRRPRVVYPAVEIKPLEEEDGGEVKEEDRWLINDRPTLLSINRFEGKKDLALALESFALARAGPSAPKGLRLVLAGGYDPRLADNVRTLAGLQQLAGSLGLASHACTAAAAAPLPDVPSPVAARFRPAIAPAPPAAADAPPDVLFVLNVSAAQKARLLARAAVLMYTPMYEHFGIVPLEGMAAGVPVLATTTGGPTETVVDAGLDDERTTGLLRARDPAAWADALSALLALGPARRATLSSAGRARVRDFFSPARLGADFERACADAAQRGMPIPYEVGFKKMVAFVGIAVIVFGLGGAAYVFGRVGAP